MTDQATEAGHDQDPGAAPQAVRKPFPLWAKIAIPVAAVVLLAAGGTLGALAAMGPKTLTVHGDLSLVSSDGSGCITGSSGFSDLTDGAQVKVSDQQGTTVALSQLGTGKESESGYLCTWNFTVSGVPTGAKFYGFHVGNTNRGVIQYSEAQLRKGVHLQIEG